jgi:SOS response regulatory protein OraA/RecX
MKSEMRDKLAQLPFEEKICKVGELIQLSRKIKAQRDREDARNYPQSGFRNPQSSELLSKNSKK